MATFSDQINVDYCTKWVRVRLMPAFWDFEGRSGSWLRPVAVEVGVINESREVFTYAHRAG